MKTNNSIDSDPEYPDIEILQSFATVAFDTCNLLLIIFFFRTTSAILFQLNNTL